MMRLREGVCSAEVCQAMLLLRLFMPLAVVSGMKVGRVVFKRESGSQGLTVKAILAKIGL